MSAGEVHRVVDQLFRLQGGRMVATLARLLGAANLELAEEVVQDALVRALQSWPERGIPENPSAWLVQAARHRALDLLRRRALHDRRAPEIARALEDALAASAAADAHELGDDQLRMMFMCAHPLLAPEARSALTLNVVSGFGAREVARAFLLEEATAAQRLVRAKRRLREAGAELAMPPPAAWGERLDAVLEAVYLLFTEGNAAADDDAPPRRGLVAEALRLGGLLASHPRTEGPRVHALLALMCLQAARIPARLDGAGDLLLLADQDRTLWDGALVAAGFRHLARAATGEAESAYHLQAAIAATHAAAPSFAATDWARILALYDRLLALGPSPVAALNRAVAVAMVRGPEAGLAAARAVETERALAAYPLLPATLAELHRRAGERDAAAAGYRAALALPCTEAERRFLLRRLAEAEGGDEARLSGSAAPAARRG